MARTAIISSSDRAPKCQKRLVAALHVNWKPPPHHLQILLTYKYVQNDYRKQYATTGSSHNNVQYFSVITQECVSYMLISGDFHDGCTVSLIIQLVSEYRRLKWILCTYILTHYFFFHLYHTDLVRMCNSLRESF